jgi:integrase
MAAVPGPKQKHAPNMKYRPGGVCEWLACSKPVLAGSVEIQVERYFCSKSCQRKDYLSRCVIGVCEHCEGPITGVKRRSRTARFCSRKCDADFRNEQLYIPTGCFRPLIEEYLSVTNNYSASTLVNVKGSLTRFFGHVFTTEKIKKLEDIKSRTMSRFMAAERARGMQSSNSVSHIKAFFDRLYEEERFDKRNPVIPRIHANYEVHTRQPYDDMQMSILWNIAKNSGKTEIKLMFAIGEESGLRASEVCNIRLADVNSNKQTIFVRLPTKNGEARVVPFHDKVTEYLRQWLLERDPRCQHDHLFHNSWLNPIKYSFHDWWRNLYGGKPEPAASFEFHRLRHTWATRLVNADMELPILQQLGGWKSLRSVQIYAKIRRSTVDRQYAAAYAVIQEKAESPEVETLSLFDFALMDDNAPATHGNQAS